MDQTSIVINIYITSDNGIPSSVPIALPPNSNEQIVTITTVLAQEALNKFQKGERFVITNTAKVSKKILKKIFTEAIPGLTVKVLKIGSVILMSVI